MAVKLFPMVLFETARAWRNQLDKRLKPLGFSQAKWRTLLHLSRAKQPMTQSQLAERMNVEGPTLVRILDRLEKDGWIKRQDSLSDRRSKTVHLTENSDSVLQEIYAAADSLRDELLSAVSSEELEQCISLLQRIKVRLEEIK